jgi:hypothetical protein
MLTLHCGKWREVPEEIKPQVSVLQFGSETEQEIFHLVLDMAGAASYAGQSTHIFTNNALVMYAMCVYAKRNPNEADQLVIMFYDGEVHDLTIDSDGHVSATPAGFFDQGMNALLELF